VENSAGSVVAAGTVANLASVSGTINLQVVQGQNGNTDSFSITVNQASVVSGGTTGTSTAFSVAAGTQLQFQTGANQGDGNSISTQFGTFTSATLGLNNLSVLTVNSAQYAITQAQSALSILTNAQGAVGAQLDELNYASNNLQTESTNLQASQSSIMDANMATVTSQFAQQQILLQTGLQSLQAANSLPGMVLKLLG
jgi:flagellin